MKRRNQQSTPPLPEGWELLAVAFGSGHDDYLACVLAFTDSRADISPAYLSQKYVTWIWNSDKGCEGVGEGHYFNPWDYSDADALAHAAWTDFCDRGGRFIKAAHTWESPFTVDQLAFGERSGI